MHSRHADIVHAARACVGTRCRVQGRVPGLALDCVGVAIAAAKGAGLSFAAPHDYCLAADNRDRLGAGLAAAGCALLAGKPRAGDLALIAVTPAQRHLAVCCGDTFVHAHFGLGRVVEAPLPPEWACTGWRFPEI
ncbi:peptidoglycan endopeptidase [uncultured Sphingosinicella sp.]|uniref:peptidoglycan endopeptidase n=1 Tax=uncultured Sphingosinicella sp. TaxID=478748 RepID=UPI0030DD6E10|tara:strand:+ start:31438 stop:31842 length:405 start_codon:yes stop_codon:yes gene_type:complete